MATAMRIVIGRLVAGAAVLASVFVLADPAGAHPLEHCTMGWKSVDGVPVEGSPEQPVLVCIEEFHRHRLRDVIISTATISAVYLLLYALIITPEAARKEKQSRPGRWRLLLRPRQLGRALPRRYWVASWCSLLPACLLGPVIVPEFLEWAFPPVSNLTVTLYVLLCGIVTVIGARILARKTKQSAQSASQATVD